MIVYILSHKIEQINSFYIIILSFYNQKLFFSQF